MLQSVILCYTTGLPISHIQPISCCRGVKRSAVILGNGDGSGPERSHASSALSIRSTTHMSSARRSRSSFLLPVSPGKWTSLLGEDGVRGLPSGHRMPCPQCCSISTVCQVSVWTSIRMWKNEGKDYDGEEAHCTRWSEVPS